MRNLTKLARELENEYSKYSYEGLCQTKEYLEILQANMLSITREYGRDCIITPTNNPNMTACTDGQNITINMVNSLITTLPTTPKKNLACKGMLAHECSHILFTDFKALKQWTEELLNITCLDETYVDFWYFTDTTKNKEMKDFFKKKPNAARSYFKLMKSMENSYEDAYVNNKIYEHYKGGSIAIGLKILMDNMMLHETPTIEENLSKDRLMTEIVVNLTHRDIMEYEIDTKKPANDDLMDKYNLIMNCIGKIKPIYEGIKHGDSNTERRTKIAYTLFDLFKEDYKDAVNKNKDKDQGEGEPQKAGDTKESNKGNGSSKTECSNEEQDTSSSGENSKDEENDESGDFSIEQSEEIDQRQEEEKTSNEPKGNSSSVKISGDDQLDTSKQTYNEEREQRELEKSLKEMAQKKAEKEVEKEHIKELNEEAKEIKNQAYKSKDCKGERFDYDIKRKTTDINSDMISYYKEVAGSYKMEKSLLVRKISSILKDREVESIERGYYTGKKFVAKDAGRYDKKMFSRINVPDGQPNVAFAILVDESGSMQGKKEDSARERANFLHDVLKELDIPHIIIGHTCYYNEDCTLFSYVDFDTQDDNDKYRLANISARSGNRDSAAITYCAEKLIRRPEERKILIVISDGAPTESGYYNSDPVKDCTICIEEYTKKGITIYGTIIDSCEMNCLKEIYGDKCLDCTDPKVFSKNLTDLVKKYVLK